MSDWVVETPSFEEDLMNNRVVMLNQNGVNRVVEIIKEKDKEIESLNGALQTYEILLKSNVLEIERLKEENNFLKQLIPNEKKYSYGIRVGSDGSETRNEEDNK